MAMREATYTRKEEAKEYTRMARALREKKNAHNGFLFRKYKLESIELDKQGISASKQLVIFREKEYLEKNGVPKPKKENIFNVPDEEETTVKKLKLSFLQKILLGVVIIVVVSKIS